MEYTLGTDSSRPSADRSESPGSGIAEASSTIVETVSELVEMMGRGGITELDLDYLDVRIRLRGAASSTSASAPGVPAPAPVAVTSNVVIPEAAATTGRNVVTAPMVGTYYSAPTPQDRPFVQVGDVIQVGQIIGIIEAMKIMNEIASEYGGIVSEIVATNGQPVEYGSELLRLAPAAN